MAACDGAAKGVIRAAWDRVAWDMAAWARPQISYMMRVKCHISITKKGESQMLINLGIYENRKLQAYF